MRIYSGKVPSISQELISTLIDGGDIECIDRNEVQLDVEAVLKEHIRRDRQVLDEAKNRMESRGMSYSMLGRTKAQVAKELGAPPSDEVIPYLVGQILNMLFHSNNVEEIYSEDTDLRKKIVNILRRHTETEGELDVAVRNKIKNLEEGTATFEIEYARMMEKVKRTRGFGE
jgi:hypothetical protein